MAAFSSFPLVLLLTLVLTALAFAVYVATVSFLETPLCYYLIGPTSILAAMAFPSV